MKTSLPKRSLIIKERLDIIVEEILACQGEKIAMIILFGSYARGDWVRDEYKEGGITYRYHSDIDLLLVLKKNKYAGHMALKIERQIKNRLERNLVRDEPWVSLIFEPIERINSELEKGQYFFSDIKKEGILLYDSGEFELAQARELSNKEKAEIAKDYYDYWYGKGCDFLLGVEFYLENGILNNAAFLLHQATESFYTASILVFTGYKGKIHDIEKLGKVARGQSQSIELSKVFCLSSEEQKECFDLLKKAYIEARYNKNYKISKEQLEYLIERVEKLKDVTRKVCAQKIREYEGDI